MPTSSSSASLSASYLAESKSYPLALLAIFLALWTILAIAPWFRQDWLLENLLVFIAVPVFVFTYRRLRFSNTAYTALFIFLALHEIGAHYTYAEVPYDAWSQRFLGISLDDALGFQRNHYDRLVHFLYGVSIIPVVVELFSATAVLPGAWRFILPVCFVMSHSVIFELNEWLAAEIFGGELGQAYLGTQGDVWDAQKDMFLAMLGSILGMLLFVHGKRQQLELPIRPGA